jgi:hypothetical protein
MTALRVDPAVLPFWSTIIWGSMLEMAWKALIAEKNVVITSPVFFS